MIRRSIWKIVQLDGVLSYTMPSAQKEGFIIMIPFKKIEEIKLDEEKLLEIEQAWLQESIQRKKEMDVGQTEPISSQEVHNYIRARIRAMRETS